MKKGELEQFVSLNRELFDYHEPSVTLKRKIERRLSRGNDPTGLLVMNRDFLKYAAAVLLIVIGMVIFKMRAREKYADGPAEETVSGPRIEKSADTPVTSPLAGTGQRREEPGPSVQKPPTKVRARRGNEDERAKRIDHYVQMVEAKQEAVAAILFTDPEINNAFAADMDALSKEYDELKAELKNTSEVNQILEAIGDNLEMQATLLNKQLELYRVYGKG